MGHRIALVSSSYHPYPGGVEEHVRNLAAQLRRDGHDVVVWTVDRGEHLGIRHVDDVEVRYLPTPLPARDVGALARLAVRLPGAWRSWAVAHREFRPDLLHVHCFGPNGLYALALHRRFGTPLVVTSHGETFADDHGVFDDSALLRWGLRTALGTAAATSAPSPTVCQDLRERFGAGSCAVVPNAVDLDEPAADVESLDWWPMSGRVVLAVGRVVPVKGFDLLLRAFARSARPDERLVIAGDGPELANLAALAADLGVADRVHLPGRLSRPGVVAAMAAASLVVVPSRVEAFGIVALEAWRAGTPLLLSSHSGAAQMIRDAENGLLVDPEDTEALGRAMRSVLDDPAFAAALSAAGTRAVQAFTWTEVAGCYEELYERVVATGQ